MIISFLENVDENTTTFVITTEDGNEDQIMGAEYLVDGQRYVPCECLLPYVSDIYSNLFNPTFLILAIAEDGSTVLIPKMSSNQKDYNSDAASSLIQLSRGEEEENVATSDSAAGQIVIEIPSTEETSAVESSKILLVVTDSNEQEMVPVSEVGQSNEQNDKLKK